MTDVENKIYSHMIENSLFQKGLITEKERDNLLLTLKHNMTLGKQLLKNILLENEKDK